MIIRKMPAGIKPASKGAAGLLNVRIVVVWVGSSAANRSGDSVAVGVGNNCLVTFAGSDVGVKVGSGMATDIGVSSSVYEYHAPLLPLPGAVRQTTINTFPCTTMAVAAEGSKPLSPSTSCTSGPEIMAWTPPQERTPSCHSLYHIP